MTLDPVLLSRLQWAWVIAWHILLPAFTVGLASYIAVLEGLYFLTGREIWFRISGFLDKDLRRLLRHGRGHRHHHAVPVRHQLEPLHRRHRRRDLAAFVLRRADGLLSGGVVSRRAFVRTPPGAAWAHFFAAVDGRVRHAVVVVLDSRDQFMDADAAGLQNRRRPLRAGRLDGHHLQSVVSVSASSTTSPRSTSPPLSSCSASAPGCCGAAGPPKTRA